MKTRICQTLTAALLALPLAMGAADDAKPSVGTTDTATVNLAVPTTDVTPAPPAGPPAPQGEVKVVQFPQPGLPPVLDQVVRLSTSGNDESVIRAYIEKAAPPYRITGHEIVQLHDLGISQGVIMALIEHSKTAAVNVTEVISPPAQTTTQPTEPEPNVVSAPATPPDAANDYYDALSPYGSWLDVPGYGRCWQPTVAVLNHDWRPYCDNGDWSWSDAGWYWNSAYSWGWAPFHYGRWFCHPERSWVWCPDRVWGPSWVCWRSSANWCGWAPLPPGACFTAGLGWTHHGARVGVDFGFGLGAAQFTFVARDHFSDRGVGSHALRGQDANTAFNRTTVVNNYSLGANNRFINQGIGREQIAASAHSPIREVSLRDMARPSSGSRLAATESVGRMGTAQALVRPGAQISAARGNNVSTFGNRTGNELASRSAARSTSMFAAPRLQSNGGTSPARTMPSYAQNNFNRTWNVTQSPRVNTAPRFQTSVTTFGRSSAPMQSMPRSSSMSFGSAPRSVGSSTYASSARSSGGTHASMGSSGRSSGGHR